MKSHLIAAAVLASGISTSAFAAVLIDDSFDYGLAEGTDLAGAGQPGWTATGSLFSTVDLDGVGGSVISNGFTAKALTTPNTADEAVNFSFYIQENVNAGNNIQGARLMMQSSGTSSNYGMGINFDYNSTTETYTIYARVGVSQDLATPLNITTSSPILLYGTYSYDRSTQTGSIAVNYDTGSGIATTSLSNLAYDNDLANDQLGNVVVFRKGGSDDQWRVDGLSLTTIPEPATLGLLGLGGLALGRRRRNA